MAVDLTRVGELSVSRIQSTVLSLLDPTPDLDSVAAFLASVDWSRAEEAPRAVRDLLGFIEQVMTDHDQNAITAGDCADSIKDLLAVGA